MQSNHIDVKDPQVYISKEARVVFDNMKLLKEFKHFDNKDFFILAVLFGYLKNKRTTLKRTEREKSGFAREPYFSENDKDYLACVAFKTQKDISIISSIPQIFAIAEEYANGGIGPLKEFVFGNPADFRKKFADLLKKTLRK